MGLIPRNVNQIQFGIRKPKKNQQEKESLLTLSNKKSTYRAIPNRFHSFKIF